MSRHAYKDNYPIGFSGWEGEEEGTFLFELGGEAEIEAYSEEGAKEEFLNLTVKELLERGMYLV